VVSGLRVCEELGAVSGIRGAKRTLPPAPIVAATPLAAADEEALAA
jgi:hypothetical protein